MDSQTKDLETFNINDILTDYKKIKAKLNRKKREPTAEQKQQY